MKKLLIALALGTLLVLALATVASADAGPHGGFNGSTDACASCHRAHSGLSSGDYLLTASNIYLLCTNCHDGTGAYTNVVNGYFDTSVADPGKNAWGTSTAGDSGGSLFGGGFVNTRNMLTDYGNAANEGGFAENTQNAGADMNTSAVSWARMNAYDNSATYAPGSRPTTSTHDVSTVGRTGYVWGSGGVNVGGTIANRWGAAAWTGATELECTSCHDPHGNAGRQGGLPTGAPFPSYRILRFTPSGSNGFEVDNTAFAFAVGTGTSFSWNLQNAPSTAGVQINDPATLWYSINNDVALDGSLLSMTGGINGTTVARAMFAGQGDYGGIYYQYRRPAVPVGTTTSGALSGTWTGCKSGGVFTHPPTACPDPTPGTAFNNLAAQDQLGYWCSTCHDRYLAKGGSSVGTGGTRVTDSGDPGYHYRHRTQGSSTTAGKYTCVSCHVAHGTSATASTKAGQAQTTLTGAPGAQYADGASYAGGSVLLRADNRAICLRCHATSVNFFNVTTTAPSGLIVITNP